MLFTLCFLHKHRQNLFLKMFNVSDILVSKEKLTQYSRVLNILKCPKISKIFLNLRKFLVLLNHI